MAVFNSKQARTLTFAVFGLVAATHVYMLAMTGHTMSQAQKNAHNYGNLLLAALGAWYVTMI